MPHHTVGAGACTAPQGAPSRPRRVGWVAGAMPARKRKCSTPGIVGSSRWHYIGRQDWQPGRNLPALGRGGGLSRRTIDAAGLQLFGNVYTNLSSGSPDTRKSLLCMCAGTAGTKAPHHSVVTAAICGISVKTLRGWCRSLDQRRWAFQSHPCQRSLAGTRNLAAVFTSPELPHVASEPVHAASAAQEWAACGAGPVCASTPPTALQQWAQHPNYTIGIRMAELATMWMVNGWSKEKFPQFLLWATERFAGALGNLNHSQRFLDSFLPSLVAATHTCIASSLHSVLPATGLPSLLSRVVDVVSINGRSLLPTILLYTSCNGKLAWALLGSPCLECVDLEATAAVGAASSERTLFGFHKAPQLVRTVHRLERSFFIHRDDRAWRLAVTVADQAIQGPGSVGFTAREHEVDAVRADPLAHGICNFHVADCSGGGVDKLFCETDMFDKMVRLLRRHFAWGTGDLILRAVATKFESMAATFEETAGGVLLRAAEAEANGQPLAAQRLNKNCRPTASRGPGLAASRVDQVEKAVGSKSRRHKKGGLAIKST